jgi:hypothetical protein
MALSPLRPVEVTTDDQTTTQPAPSRTYQLNANKNEISGLIDGETALRQFIVKAMRTARFRFLIYDDQYGSEIEDLIGADVSQELLNVEVPRIIRETLVYDDRIDDVVDFEITRDSDKLLVSFRVVVADGTSFNQEVTI